MTPQPIARNIIPTFVWLDEGRRIRRMSFEMLYDEIAGDATTFSTWAITELWDFGVAINRVPPSVS